MKTIIYITLVFLIGCEEPLTFDINYTDGIVEVCTPEYCGVGFYVKPHAIITTGNLISDKTYLIVDGVEINDFEIIKTDEYNNMVMISVDDVEHVWTYKVCTTEVEYGDEIYANNGYEIKKGNAYPGMVPAQSDWILTTIDGPRTDEGSPIFDIEKGCVVTIGVDRLVRLCGPSTDDVRNFINN